MNFEEVKYKVESALTNVRAQEAFLLEVNVNERTISHKLAEYLQPLFDQLKVDCE